MALGIDLVIEDELYTTTTKAHRLERFGFAFPSVFILKLNLLTVKFSQAVKTQK